MNAAVYDTTVTTHANLLELASVVSGGIVSKSLLDRGDVKQILFAMDADQAISEHHVPCPATVHLLDGQLDFAVTQQQYEMRPGDWLMIPPDAPHALKAIKPSRFLLTLLKEPTS